MGLCSVDTSMCSTCLCSVDTSRCNTRLCSVDSPRSSTGVCSVDTSIISKQQRFAIPKKMLAQAQPAQTFFSAGSASEGNFFAQAEPAQTFFQRRLSLRRQIVSAGSVCINFFPVLTVFFSAGSACVGIFLAQTQPAQTFFLTQAQPAQAFFQRTLSMRKKHKMANICRSLRKKTKIYPVLKSPAHMGNLTLGHL